eukprot:4937764-Ditylum_brightwellii.AAC.1
MSSASTMSSVKKEEEGILQMTHLYIEDGRVDASQYSDGQLFWIKSHEPQCFNMVLYFCQKQQPELMNASHDAPSPAAEAYKCCGLYLSLFMQTAKNCATTEKGFAHL